MESANIFNYIDGFNLNFEELKLRLAKMGIENLDHITDFGYFANLYNDIMNSRDIRFISKIKFILEEDKERSNFFDLLNKKRARALYSEKKESNGFAHSSRRELNHSQSLKNGYSKSERKINSDLLNKYPSEDKIVKSFFEKQENHPFIFSHSNSNGNINYDEFLKNDNNEYNKSVDESNLKLRQHNKISVIKSNVIHKSESEQTIKNGFFSTSNQKGLENPINKPLKDDVANFTAPLNRRLSEKVLINMNAYNAYAANPLYNQPLRTPSNSNKNLIEIQENTANANFDAQNMNNYNNNNYDNNLINLQSNSKSINLNLDNENSNNNNNFERRYSNNRIPNLSNSEKRNSLSNNNLLNPSKLRTTNFQNNQTNNERLFRSNNNIVFVPTKKNLIGGESSISKSDCNIKFRSNPLLQYITIGIKSNEDFKRQNTNPKLDANKNSSNRSSRRKPDNSAAIANKSDINAFSVYANSAAENSKKIFEKGIFVVKDNYKTILALFMLLGGGAYVFKLYKANPSIFTDMYNFLKSFLPNGIFDTLAKFFNVEFIKENVFTVCILTAVLISLVFVILKYREHVRFSKIAQQDYKLIKQILEASRHKEDNCDLIGLFENNFVKDNSERHNFSEESYRRRVMPFMHDARLDEDLIEEGEILIQDQAQKVWRLRKDNNVSNSSDNLMLNEDDCDIEINNEN